MSTITVTMAFHGAHQWLRRAVESILAQTYEDWRLVIVNDADNETPWPYLAGVTDPRIVRFDMDRNRGRYFIDAVIFEALQPEYWALQDPDDHADPRRFELMLPIAQEHGAAFAPTWLYKRGERRPPDHDTTGMTLAPQASRIRHMVGYGSGVISGERIRAAGGFHPGFRVGFDTYLMNAVKLVGPWRAIGDPPLQHKLVRPGSLKTDPVTGLGSPHRNKARAHLDELWREAYQRHAEGKDIASVITNDIDPALHAAVITEATRLRLAADVGVAA